VISGSVIRVCVCVDSRRPELELEALIKRHFTKVEYFKGSIMSTRDIERVKVTHPSVPFARWRYVRLAVSYTFDRGQHGRLCPCPSANSKGRIVSRRDTSEITTIRRYTNMCIIIIIVIFIAHELGLSN